MKHIYLNLKRFDVPTSLSGVNSIAPVQSWASSIIKKIDQPLKQYSNAKFSIYFPESHLLPAIESKSEDSVIHIGCQSVYRDDVKQGGNFGAFTTNRPAASMKAIGCDTTIIGHCEERNDKAGILKMAGLTSVSKTVNDVLNQEIKCALNQGLSVLYCIGETSEEQDRWEEVLGEQLELGLKNVDTTNVVIAYEPIWSIGPNKTPASKDYIQKIAKFVKEKTGGLPVVYGGGLKLDNAKMLASIPEIDGGLIALTRFQGEIGYYPEEYLEIISSYMND